MKNTTTALFSYLLSVSIVIALAAAGWISLAASLSTLVFLTLAYFTNKGMERPLSSGSFQV